MATDAVCRAPADIVGIDHGLYYHSGRAATTAYLEYMANMVTDNFRRIQGPELAHAQMLSV